MAKVGDLVRVDLGQHGRTYVGLIVRVADPCEYDFEVWLAEVNGTVPVYRNEIAEIISGRKE
tara:strand:+ start:1559 stop:1744 length:186 start_codon:yes stop_codon:yes gene_type:complete